MKFSLSIILVFLFLNPSEAAVLAEYKGREVVNYKGGLGLVSPGSSDTAYFEELTNDERKLVIQAILNSGNNSPYRIDDEVLHPENKWKAKYARIAVVIIALGFLINLPFFIFWAKRQKGSEEVLFYNVRGKYTYLSVLDWVARLERLNKCHLKAQRQRIEEAFNRAQKVNKSIRIYTRQIHDVMLIKSFGKKMIRTAFNRMATYTKIVYLWDIAIYLSIINATILSLSVEYDWGLAVVLGVLAGNIVAAPIWFVFHLIFNHWLKYVATKEIEKGKGVGLRIIMAQFYGGFAGLVWKDLHFIKGQSSWLIGPEYVGWGIGFSSFSSFSSGGSSFGGFGGGGFGGGGAGGSW